MSYLLNGDRIIMGTDYYPEHCGLVSINSTNKNERSHQP